MFLQQYSDPMCMYTWHIQPIRCSDLQRKLHKSHVENQLLVMFQDGLLTCLHFPFTSRIYQLHTDLHLSALCPSERTSTRPWIPVMGTTYEKQGVRYLLLLSEVAFYEYKHGLPTQGGAAHPAQLLSIFLGVGEFWCHLSDWILEVRWEAI